MQFRLFLRRYKSNQYSFAQSTAGVILSVSGREESPVLWNNQEMQTLVLRKSEHSHPIQALNVRHKWIPIALKGVPNVQEREKTAKKGKKVSKKVLTIAGRLWYSNRALKGSPGGKPRGGTEERSAGILKTIQRD